MGAMSRTRLTGMPTARLVGRLDPSTPRGFPVYRVFPDRQAYPESRGLLARAGYRERQVPPELLVHRVHLESPGHKDRTVLLDLPERQVQSGH